LLGAGVVAYHLEREAFKCRIGLGTQAEVYDAEMAGLARAAQESIRFAAEHNVQHIHIFTDNTGALFAAPEPTMRVCQQHAIDVRKAFENFLDNDETRTFELAWSPGHKGIRGNERADTIAKRATAIPVADSRTLTHQKRIYRQRSMAEWQAVWDRTAFPQHSFAPAKSM
jgi:ribonuclease HI